MPTLYLDSAHDDEARRNGLHGGVNAMSDKPLSVAATAG
jgi:hypothetical protein